MLKFVFFSILGCTFNCNIMDNIFGNYNAPNIYIPRDFELVLGISK